MKKILTCAAAMVAAILPAAFAQTTNLALTNADGTGYATAFTITELDGSSEASFQMWIKPTAWTHATLIGQDNFSVEMSSTAGQFTVTSGDQTATITTGDDLVGKWSQLTITVGQGTVTAYINNEAATVSGSLPATFEETAYSFDEQGCMIAEGLHGQIDEIRVWTCALAQEDIFWQNTINKFNDNYDALAAYWKCDQGQLPDNIYDYKNANSGRHHNGTLQGITKEEVTDNDMFKYRVVAGYVPNIMRFTDRPYISRDMFLLTNDALLLSAKVQEDGSLFPEYPDNTATPTNVDYLAEYEGREGVMSFNGNGSQMVAADARVPFDPTTSTGHGATQYASVMAWIYIDEWNEGAEIYSNYISDDECVVIKLGSEDEKELIVDLCGTVGTLSGVLETGKWQYVGVYLKPTQGSLTGRLFNPIYIGIGEYDESGEFVSSIYTKMSDTAVTLSGNDMTISFVPNFEEGSTMTIGKNFNGKIDELMVWGSDRYNYISTDATEEYQWNIGSWNNIFLNAYYKGDDPEDVGKDSQSYKGIVEIIKNYYAGHSGSHVRIGIISSLDNEGWKSVLNQEEYVDNFISDAKVMLAACDGLDLDLEWMYSTSEWNIYNNVVGRLINEVMSEAPEKTFSCSLHEVSYSGFDDSLTDGVDYFTFQQYGPNIIPTLSRYEQYCGYFMNKFPTDKILLSYATLIVTGSSEEGYKDLFDKYGMTDDNFDPDVNSWSTSSTTYYYSGLNMVKDKQQVIIDNDLRGTMYFDMANDLSVDDYKSLIRAQNEVISANVDTVITNVNLTPSGIKTIKNSKTGNTLFTAVQEQSVIDITLADATDGAILRIVSVDGRIVKQVSLTSKTTAVETTGLQNGIYLLNVTQGGKKQTVKMAIK